MTRKQLEALEETDPHAFWRKLQDFAEGQLTKDNFDEMVERMYDQADSDSDDEPDKSFRGFVNSVTEIDLLAGCCLLILIGCVYVIGRAVWG